MPTSTSVHSVYAEEDFSFPSDGLKPFVDKPKGGGYKFKVADTVYLRLASAGEEEGPYLVARAQGGKYALCDDNDKMVKGGQMFDEAVLVGVTHRV